MIRLAVGSVVVVGAAEVDVADGEDAGDVVTGDVVTGDVVTGVASDVVASESGDEPEHAASAKMPTADIAMETYLFTVAPLRRVPRDPATDSTTAQGVVLVSASCTHRPSA